MNNLGERFTGDKHALYEVVPENTCWVFEHPNEDADQR